MLIVNRDGTNSGPIKWIGIPFLYAAASRQMKPI